MCQKIHLGQQQQSDEQEVRKEAPDEGDEGTRLEHKEGRKTRQEEEGKKEAGHVRGRVTNPEQQGAV